MLDIRKQIHVTDFSIDEKGIKVEYLFNGEPKSFEYAPTDATDALEEAGVIDFVGMDDGRLVVDGNAYTWEEYVEEVGMYQYAAILLAVNREAAERKKQEAKRTVDPLMEHFNNIAKTYAKAVYGVNI